MRKNYFALILLCTISGASPLLAQSDPPRSLVTKSATCTPPDVFGNNQAGCTVACPVGSTLASGGCTASGPVPWSIRDSSRSGNGWQCGSFDALGIGNGNYRNTGNQLSAHVNCSSLSISTRAAWQLPGAGNQIAIARQGIDLATPIARGFMVCNVDSADAATAIIYIKTTTAPGFQTIEPEPKIEKNKCLLVSRPTALFLANYATQARTISGFYQSFSPDAFGSDPTQYQIVDLDSVVPATGESKAVQDPASCKRVPNPNNRDNIYSTCAIPSLTAGKDYRVCFSANYTDPQPNGQSYPGTLAPMVLDANLLNKPLPATPPENLYNPIAPNSCRDLYGVQSASFIVWPYRTDPANATWQPEKVYKILVTVETLP